MRRTLPTSSRAQSRELSGRDVPGEILRLRVRSAQDDRARGWRFILLLLSLLLFFGGCEPEDGRTRVRIWHQKIGAERTLFNEIVARYNAAQDSILVETLYRETEEMRNLFVVGSVGG